MVVNYKGHTERIQLTVTQLRKQHIILGYSWLQKHNPEINWETKEVCMMCCPTGCRTCWVELRVVQRNEKLATLILWQLHKGLTPSICAVNSEEWRGDNGYNLYSPRVKRFAPAALSCNISWRLTHRIPHRLEPRFCPGHGLLGRLQQGVF
jgi:hypothetical protein